MGMKFLSPKDKNSVPVSIEVNIKESINWNFFLFLLILYHLLDVLFSCEMLLALSFDKKYRLLSSGQFTLQLFYCAIIHSSLLTNISPPAGISDFRETKGRTENESVLAEPSESNKPR